MKPLMRLAAVLEIVTGAALLAAPSAVTFWILREDLSPGGTALGRVTGFALIALGLACWPSRETTTQTTPAWAMFTYSVLVAIYLGYYGVSQSAGALLWPAVVAHVVFAILFVAAWSRDSHHVAA